MNPQTFTKTEAARRVRDMIRAQEWNTKGRRVEIQYVAATPGAYPDGITYPLSAGLERAHLEHGAELRVLLSTRGTWAELQDAFRMNLGTPETPAYLVTR